MERLYVLVRNDLPLAYQGVQGGHGLARWLLDNPNQTWNNEYLIYLQVENEEALRRWTHKLKVKGYTFSLFYEPDIGNQLTALACQPNSKIFRNLKKMGD